MIRWPEHIKKEWDDGFEAGMKWCEELSKREEGFEVSFWPDHPNGVYWNGYAEGTITGGSEYNVTWRGVRVVDGKWIVAKDKPRKVI